MPSKVWDDITFSFPNFSGFTAEVWEWTSNFIPYFIMDSMTGLKVLDFSKGAPGILVGGNGVNSIVGYPFKSQRYGP